MKTTYYNDKFFANELTRRCASVGVGKLAGIPFIASSEHISHLLLQGEGWDRGCG
jgi:hypothetical protein